MKPLPVQLEPVATSLFHVASHEEKASVNFVVPL